MKRQKKGDHDVFDHELRREVLKVTMLLGFQTFTFLAAKRPIEDLLAELVVRIHMQYGLL